MPAPGPPEPANARPNWPRGAVPMQGGHVGRPPHRPPTLPPQSSLLTLPWARVCLHKAACRLESADQRAMGARSGGQGLAAGPNLHAGTGWVRISPHVSDHALAYKPCAVVCTARCLAHPGQVPGLGRPT